MLRETEWTTINHVLLDIYTVTDFTVLTTKVMRGLRLLVPYSKGYAVLFNEEQEVLEESLCVVGFDENRFKRYLQKDYVEDYLKYLFDFDTKLPIYQDTNVLMDNIRMFTPFYSHFLEPQDCAYGCGLLMIRSNRIVGLIELFRSKQTLDFTGRDIYVMNILKSHIENIACNTLKMARTRILNEKCFDRMKDKYHLTERECEILRLLSEGASGSEIGEKLLISASTVKKHIYNLYNKTEVKNRTQLLNRLYDSGDKNEEGDE